MRPRRSPIALTLFGVSALLSSPLSAAPAAPAAPAAEVAVKGAAEAAQPWRLGALRLETDVVGAEVWIDERPVGRAPLPGAWALPGGSHAVRLELDGWRVSAQALVSVGSVTTLTLNRDGLPGGAGASAVDALELPPQGPAAQVERVHPGAGIPVRGVGYTLLTIGVGALGYGVYAHLAADQERLRALQVGEARAAERERALSGAVSDLWGARLAVGGGLLGALSGLAMLGWSREGWFVEEEGRGGEE